MTKSDITSRLFDVFLIFFLFILVTGAYYLLSAEWMQFFATHPKKLRALLSLLTGLIIACFVSLDFSGRLTKHSLVVRSIQRLRIHPFSWTILIFILAFSVFSYSSYLRHRVLHSSFDFAIFAQAIWNTWHGDLLYSSIKGGINLMGDHVSPLLIVLSPFFYFGDSPIFLFVVQAMAAASSVFPIYFISKKVLADEKLSLAFVISFSVYLPLRNAVRFDFHPELLVDPFILWAFYFILKDRLKLASVFLALTLTSKEIACGPVAMMGLYLWWVRKRTWFGLLWFFIAVFVFYADIKIIAPFFNNDPYFYLEGNYLKWKELGLSAFLNHLFQPSTLSYLQKIFMPLGFLSLLSPSHLILTFPILFQNLATRNIMARSTYFQYTALLTPFVFISAIYGFRNLFRFISSRSLFADDKIRKALVYWLLGFSLMFMGISEFYVIMQLKNEDSPHVEYVRRYLTNVPSNFSVRTHEFFAPHLINRKHLFIFENNHPREGGSQRALNADLVILDKRFIRDDDRRKLRLFQSKGQYLMVHHHDGFVVFKNKRLDNND